MPVIEVQHLCQLVKRRDHCAELVRLHDRAWHRREHAALSWVIEGIRRNSPGLVAEAESLAIEIEERNARRRELENENANRE